MIQIILSISDVCCNKFFILQVFHEQAQAETVPMFVREARWAQTVLRSNMGAQQQARASEQAGRRASKQA
jgi:hypothetical protein